MKRGLTLKRMEQAKATLDDAMSLCHPGLTEGRFPGALQQKDPFRVFCEAKRNLIAMIKFLHGQKAWEKNI